MNPGIYIHLPFCAVHCSYCDFPLTTRTALSNRYYHSLLKEIEMRPFQTCADSLYFGGGTPSRTPAQVLEEVRKKFDLQTDAEITLEANPDDICSESLDAWKRVGITRLSIGIQSLEDSALRSMLRIHSASGALEALSLARSAGFGNVNVDLILGAPGQTVNGFFEGVSRLLEFGPEHFSMYLLEVHEKTALHRQLRTGKLRLMEEEDQLTCYKGVIRLLKEKGYEHYEVSNFALPGFASRHNMKYWTGAPYAAYGAGACSFLDGTRITNIASISEYIDALQAGRLAVGAEIREDRDTGMRNALIFGLRKTEGIRLHAFEHEYGLSPITLFGKEGKTYLEENLLEISGDSLRLTLAGMLVSNEILSNLV